MINDRHEGDCWTLNLDADDTRAAPFPLVTRFGVSKSVGDKDEAPRHRLSSAAFEFCSSDKRP